MRPKSHFTSAISFIAILLLCWYAFHSQTPSAEVEDNVPLEEWSTQRALNHVKALSQEPHYVGSPGHAKAREYIITQLESLGLSVETQRGFTLDEFGNLAEPINILARIEGTDPDARAVVLSTHYDSDPHSSLGASDAASGVATIIEGVRTFLHSGKKPKNDVIVLITDSEELGLNGASLFVNEHPWADDVAIVLNFESRGSGGPSYMLVETNGGNQKIIEAFSDAGVDYPVANSLAYSIYKMLPNSTDLTVFRVDKDINGLNFAFIGDHFDYHTQLDNYERLDRNSLAHQGSYLMPQLKFFANDARKGDYKTEKGNDLVYFPLPGLDLVSFPFSWLPIMIIVGGIGLLILIVLGVKKSRIKIKDVFIGFVPFLISLILSYLLITYGFQVVAGDVFYVDKGSVFPYNGYWWVAAASALALAICFALYHLIYHRDRIASHSVAPLFFLWLIALLICFPVGDGGLIPGIFLPGAGFFLVPFFMGLILVWLNIYQKRPSYILTVLLAIPTIFIFVPFIKAFPVALGMSILFLAGILTVLVFGLMMPIFGHYRKKGLLAIICLLVAGGFIVTAFAKAEFSKSQPQSTSLLYIADLDAKTAKWASYDAFLTNWTREKLGDAPEDAQVLGKNVADSKYRSRIRHTAPADFIAMDSLNIQVLSDTLLNQNRRVKLSISSNSKVNRYEVFADTTYQFTELIANEKPAPIDEETGLVYPYRRGNRLISYYVNENKPLELEMSFSSDQEPELMIYAASFDLLENKDLNVSSRPENQIPMPFVLNDAVIRKKSVTLNQVDMSESPSIEEND
ncbi:peptidase, M28 family protein [Nonlabens spongiae]|uniref:Vacuolar membrane protease n=1 Tax=Nonlabens spongiae TaxID=331648 RepID=A0A1W6ML04_9FLAO|nr:M28 family peptidase [Nonlabens spongiae]ARN78257.1 peptidase, M28 family protein [Nonlabens spongiae]